MICQQKFVDAQNRNFKSGTTNLTVLNCSYDWTLIEREILIWYNYSNLFRKWYQYQILIFWFDTLESPSILMPFHFIQLKKLVYWIFEKKMFLLVLLWADLNKPFFAFCYLMTRRRINDCFIWIVAYISAFVFLG